MDDGMLGGIAGGDGGGGAGGGDCAAGKHCGGGSAENFRGGGGDGRTLWGLPQRGFGGLESDEARNADRHAVWRYTTAASGSDAGRGAATADIFPRRGDERAVSSERRGLHCFHEGYWRR